MQFMVVKCLLTIILETFFYCDSGMIPWLLIIELLSKQQRSLSQVVAGRQQRYPASGEINLRIAESANFSD